MLERTEKISIFKEETWGPRAHSLYLQKKNEFDKITFNILSNPSENIIQEIYFRLKDGEETWESIAKQLSPPNQIVNYNVGPVAVSSVPQAILKAILAHSKSTIIPPIFHNNSFYVAELVEIHSSEFNSALKENILNQALESWLENACKDLTNTIQFD